MILPEDLRLRLVSALVLVLAIAFVADLAVAALALCAALALAWSARRDRDVWRRIAHVELFVILLVVTLPFAVPGTPLVSAGPLVLSAEGLLRAALVGTKVSASVITIMALLGDIEPVRLGAALHALKLPEPLVRLFVMMVRYVSVLRGEARRLMDAMRARGFVPRSSRHTWRSYGYLIGMLLVRAIERAERVEEAMRCRGFSGRFAHAGLAAPLARDWARFALLAGLALVLLLFGWS